MIRPTDESLMAYVDGMLEAEQQAAVEEYLASDADAARLVEAFKKSRTLAAAAFDQPMREPPPERLVAAIMGAGATAASQPISAGVVELRHGKLHLRKGKLRERTWRRGAELALAASLAIVAGLGGFLTGRIYAPSPTSTILALGRVPSGHVMTKLLDTKTTGSGVHLNMPTESRTGDLSAQVVATFRDRSGRICREIEIALAGSTSIPQMVGIACRDDDGDWVVEGAVRVLAAGPAAASGYKPSGANGSDALESVLQALGAGTALTADEERQLMSRGWK